MFPDWITGAWLFVIAYGFFIAGLILFSLEILSYGPRIRDEEDEGR